MRKEKMKPGALILLGALVAVFVSDTLAADDVTPSPVTTSIWQESVISVTDLDQSARFFREIGAYEIKWQGPLDPTEISAWNLPRAASAEAMLLGPPGVDAGHIRLVRFDNTGRKEPMRPGSRPWDTGCYFSLMVRMKDMHSIYDDAIAMGWWTETPITYLEFGTSKLYVMIFRGPDGVQVQGYERLEPPLPTAIPTFERITQPFNVMQMVRDRDAAYDFFTQILGFDTFYNGKPYVDKEPTHMPLGIPINLTTSIPYKAGIVYPFKGEFGRMEMIEIYGLEGRDHSDRCLAPNLGILSVRFPVDDAEVARDAVLKRGWQIETDIERIRVEPFGQLDRFTVKTPDGAIIEFYQLSQ